MKKKFKTCKEAFLSVGLQYDNYVYKCYNEEITAGTQLCPFAINDTCRSLELPDTEQKFKQLQKKMYTDFCKH